MKAERVVKIRLGRFEGERIAVVALVGRKFVHLIPMRCGKVRVQRYLLAELEGCRALDEGMDRALEFLRGQAARYGATVDAAQVLEAR